MRAYIKTRTMHDHRVCLTRDEAEAFVTGDADTQERVRAALARTMDREKEKTLG